MSYPGPERPHNDLPLLPPQANLETRAVLKACVTARAAVAELKAASDLLPNPAVLVNTIPLLEAQSSSAIENVVTTSDRLFRYMDADEGADPATREALRYRTALLGAFGSLRERPLGTRTAERIATEILDVETGVRRVPGTRLANPATGEVIYTPPVGEARLRDLLSNWERFVHAGDPLDPLVRMAVAHYQFEAIHPFTDGNGRTGRILNILMLVERGLIDLPVLYLSRSIIARKSEYYRHLLGVTAEGAWEPWLLYMLSVASETASWTTAKIRAARKLIDATVAYVRHELPKIYSHELVELLFEQPYCRIGNVVDAGIVERQTASRYLKELARIGVLEEVSAGREKLFVNRRFFALLTADSNAFDAFA